MNCSHKGWGVKAGTVCFVCGWQVKLCDPLVTHGPHLSALDVLYIKNYINSSVYFYVMCNEKRHRYFVNKSCLFCEKVYGMNFRMVNDG